MSDQFIPAAVLALSALPALADPMFVSTNVSGGISTGDNHALDMSPDARFIVFSAAADDMVPGDVNGYPDLVVLDRLTNEREIVTVGATYGDLEPADVSLFSASISADGRFVAFTTRIGGMAGVAGPAEDQQLYVRDRQAGVTRQIIDSRAGFETLNAFGPQVSDDGRYVVCPIYSMNLATMLPEIRVVHVDMQTDTQVILNAAPDGLEQGSLGNHVESYMSANGRYVAVQTTAQLLPEIPAGVDYPYLWDRELDVVTPLHRTATGEVLTTSALLGGISRTGRYVLLTSATSKFTGDPSGSSGPPDGERHLMRKDVVTEAVVPVDLDEQGQQLPGIGVFGYQISTNGRYVSFQGGTKLILDMVPQVGGSFYSRDMHETRSALASLFQGVEIAPPTGPISDDGRYMLMTGAGDIYPAGMVVPPAKFTRTAGDVFLYDRSPVDLTAQLSQLPGTWRMALTIENHSDIEASWVVAELTSDEPLRMIVEGSDFCYGVSQDGALPRFCIVESLPAHATKTINVQFEPGGATRAQLQLVLHEAESDSNETSNTAHITMTAPDPPPDGGGGGGNGGGGGGATTAGLLGLALLRLMANRTARTTWGAGR